MPSSGKSDCEPSSFPVSILRTLSSKDLRAPPRVEQAIVRTDVASGQAHIDRVTPSMGNIVGDSRSYRPAPSFPGDVIRNASSPPPAAAVAVVVVVVPAPSECDDGGKHRTNSRSTILPLAVRYAVSNARPLRTSRPIGGGGGDDDDDACGPPPPPPPSSSKRGTRPLNLASRNAIVPRPRIPTTLTERPAAPTPPRRYRSLEKSRHVPRSDRSADLTASPTSDAGRAGSYADDNDNGPDADDAVRRGAGPPSSRSRSPSRSCGAVAERRTGDPTVPLPGGRECGGDDDDDDDDHVHADAAGDDADERRRRRRRRRRTSTGRDDIDATAGIVLLVDGRLPLDDIVMVGSWGVARYREEDDGDDDDDDGWRRGMNAAQRRNDDRYDVVFKQNEYWIFCGVKVPIGTT